MGKLDMTQIYNPVAQVYCNIKMRHLSDLMTAQKLSKLELAECTGVTRQSIHNYLTGRSNPDSEWLVTTSKYFGCSVDYLLDLSPYKNESELYETLISTHAKELDERYKILEQMRYSIELLQDCKNKLSI